MEAQAAVQQVLLQAHKRLCFAFGSGTAEHRLTEQTKPEEETER